MPEPVSATFGSIFGLKYASLIAGFIGGLVSLSFVRTLTKVQMGMSVLVGSVCAGYLTPLGVQYFHFTSEVENGIAFLVGLTAMNLIPGFMNLTKRWREGPTGYAHGGMNTSINNINVSAEVNEPPPRSETYDGER